MMTDNELNELIAQIESITKRLLELDDEMEAILPIREDLKRAA
jgi:hypothetical protein